MGRLSKISIPNCITIYYRTEKETEVPSPENKAWIIFYYKGDIFAEEGEPLVDEYYAIRNITPKNIYDANKERSYQVANQLTMKKLNSENRWYVFKEIRTIADLNTTIRRYFTFKNTREECLPVREKLIEIRAQLEEEEREKWAKMKDNYTD